MLDVEGRNGVTKDAKVTLQTLPTQTRWFAHAVELLPGDRTQSLVWVMGFFVVLCVIGSIRYYSNLSA